MTKILFICHGNICRSPMAEFVFNHLVSRAGLSSELHADSAATSTEETGNDIHPGTRRKLTQMKIPFSSRRARQVTKADYRIYDYLIVMDGNNLRNLRRVIGEDRDGKVYKLLDFTGRKGEDIADPWYTGNFDETYDDVKEGCEGLIGYLGYYIDSRSAVKGFDFMDAIELTIPAEGYLDQVWDYRRECMEADSHMDGCGPLRQAETPAEWLAYVTACMNPDTVPEGKVQATLFLAVRKSDNKVVAMIQVRHYFNEYLEKYAGNIGYSTRPSERRKGYATEMLRLTLPFCREIGLDRVLIACEPGNPASRRTILANGGVYERTVHEPGADIDLERYWIEL